MTFSEPPTSSEIEAAKADLDEISIVMIESMQMRGVHTSHIAKAIERLDPMRVSPEFIASVERSYFRTKDDTGANTNARFIWNQVRKAASMEPLSEADLIKRTVDGYYADAQRAEANGNFEKADKYRRIARTIMAENPKVYPVTETVSA